MTKNKAVGYTNTVLDYTVAVPASSSGDVETSMEVTTNER